MEAGEIEGALQALAPRFAGKGARIEQLRLLTGGASMQTWSFDIVDADRAMPLILRRAPATARAENRLSLEMEARMIAAAGAAGVAVPAMVHIAAPEDGLGEAIIMARLSGETLGRRIVHGAEFAPARALLGAQCGEALARIHGVQDAALDALPVLGPRATLERFRDRWEPHASPRPAIEAAFAWLAARAPDEGAPILVHGDFRTGNLMVDAEIGLVGVLDWELAHRGDPAEDLGWLCVNSWRFGMREKEVGGFADLADVLGAYRRTSGVEIDPARVRWWQIMGSLKWAVMIRGMFAHGGGSVERAVIGRRLSECEADLASLLRDAA